MDEVIVHPRVHERHPEVSVEDVLSAWKHAIGWTTLAHGFQWEWTSRGGCWRWLLFIMGVETGLFIML